MFWNNLVFATILILSATAGGVENPTLINVALNKSYVPVGFDDNDRVQITVSGIFPSTCYKVGPAGAEVNEKRKTIRIWQTAYHYNGICIKMLVPFSQVTNVGIVKEGTYDLYDGPTEKYLGKLPVIRSTNTGPDDFLYAPMDDSFIITDAAGTNTLVLLGSFSDRCTIFKDVNVYYYPEVIVVQPIAERISDELCSTEKNRFSKTVVLDASLKGMHLLHVRSMNGQAINKLVDIGYLE